MPIDFSSVFLSSITNGFVSFLSFSHRRFVTVVLRIFFSFSSSFHRIYKLFYFHVIFINFHQIYIANTSFYFKSVEVG